MPDPSGPETLFAYDSSRQALVFDSPDGRGPMGISVKALVAAGWHATDEGLRASLPRFGKPVIEIAPALPTGLPGLDRALNGGRRRR